MVKRAAVFASILAGLLLISSLVQAEIKVPGRTGSLVNDYAGVLSADTKVFLEKILRDLRGDNFTGTEIEVSTFKTLDGMSFEKFMPEYAGKWRRPVLIENDNRIHIVIIVEDGKSRMGVGRYLESAVTPDISKHIMSGIMVPEFEKGNYDEGVKKGIGEIIDVINKSKLPRSYGFLYVKRFLVFGMLLILAILILLILRRKH